MFVVKYAKKFRKSFEDLLFSHNFLKSDQDCCKDVISRIMRAREDEERMGDGHDFMQFFSQSGLIDYPPHIFGQTAPPY
jgi:hypothetical protein